MLQQKKSHPKEKHGLHPRSKHRERYDFKTLISSYTELVPFVRFPAMSGDNTIAVKQRWHVKIKQDRILPAYNIYEFRRNVKYCDPGIHSWAKRNN